jgi:hypothetical protein
VSNGEWLKKVILFRCHSNLPRTRWLPELDDPQYKDPNLSPHISTPAEMVVDPTRILFHPRSIMNTDNFLYTYTNWASTPPILSKNYKFTSKDILHEFSILCLIHVKRPVAPEHEYLVIDTIDKSGNHQFFGLERMGSDEGHDAGPQDIPEDRSRNPGRKLKDSCSASCMDPLAALEQSSHLTSADCLQISTDNITVSSVHSAALLLKSIDKSPGTPAIDRIFGQSYVVSPTRSGQNVQYFQPNGMSLFQFAVLAEVVHNQHPTYSLLGAQCFFYAGLVYTAAKKIFGICPNLSTVGVAYVTDSHLPDRYGRYKGVKVTEVNSEDVSAAVTAYRIEYEDEVALVIILYYIIFIHAYFDVLYRSSAN